MKKIAYIFAGLLLMNASCQKEDKGIDMVYLAHFAIPAGSNTVETHYYEINLPTEAAAFLGDKHNSVEKIHLSSGRLINLEGVPYDFVREMSVSVEERIYEVGYREYLPSNVGTALDLIPNGTNVKQFMVQDNFKLVVRMLYATPPPTTIDDNQLELRFSAF
jgi:hypothetical protein